MCASLYLALSLSCCNYAASHTKRLVSCTDYCARMALSSIDQTYISNHVHLLNNIYSVPGKLLNQNYWVIYGQQSAPLSVLRYRRWAKCCAQGVRRTMAVFLTYVQRLINIFDIMLFKDIGGTKSASHFETIACMVCYIIDEGVKCIRIYMNARLHRDLVWSQQFLYVADKIIYIIYLNHPFRSSQGCDH